MNVIQKVDLVCGGPNNKKFFLLHAKSCQLTVLVTTVVAETMHGTYR